ncbi:hypothetical protein CBL_00213 [Carabus blaptoides fortunei]
MWKYTSHCSILQYSELAGLDQVIWTRRLKLQPATGRDAPVNHCLRNNPSKRLSVALAAAAVVVANLPCSPLCHQVSVYIRLISLLLLLDQTWTYAPTSSQDIGCLTTGLRRKPAERRNESKIWQTSSRRDRHEATSGSPFNPYNGKVYQKYLGSRTGYVCIISATVRAPIPRSAQLGSALSSSQTLATGVMYSLLHINPERYLLLVPLCLVPLPPPRAAAAALSDERAE